MTDLKSIYAFRHVIFDLDGTLIDSVPACIAAFAKTLEPYGVPRDEAEAFYRATTGQNLFEQYPEILARRDILLTERRFRALEAAFNEAFGGTEVAYFRKAPWLVHSLRLRGAKLYLSSASSDVIVGQRLARGGVGSSFALMYGSTEVPKGRRHVEKFVAESGVTPEVFKKTTAYCGDSETDMRIAREAGLYAIGVLGTVSAERLKNAGAHRVVTSVTTLHDDRR